MWLDFLILALGGAMLYFGAEWLVRGAAGYVVKIGVRPLLIGLTVVSYATSAPELAVSVSASLRGESAIALGNVIGSNIANIGLILGVSAMIARPRSDGTMAGKELVILGLGTALLPLLLLDGEFGRIEGILFLIASVAFTFLTIRWSRNRKVDLDEVPSDEPLTKFALIGIGVLGLVVLISGGELFVRGAVGIAESLGVSPHVIGVTVVAFGTSVPELAASVVAALRGHADLAIGNVIGSNIFNLLLILGAAGTVRPFSADLNHILVDLAVLVALTIFCIAALWRKRQMTRVEGGLLAVSYLAFIAAVALGAA